MASLDTLTSFHRLYATPLDDSIIFNSVSNMLNYIKNTGAPYEGQKMSVVNSTGIVDYTIHKGIPIIDLKGTEALFKTVEFQDTNYVSMLIYDSGFNNASDAWTTNDLFKISAEKYSLFNQLQIICGDKYIFTIHVMDIDDGIDNIITKSFSQTFDPIYGSNTNNETDYLIMNKSIPTNGDIISTDVISDIHIMPTGTTYTSDQKKKHIKIYAAADDYYYAHRDFYRGGK